MSGRIKKIAVATWTVINIAVAAALIVSGYGGMVNPDVSVIPAIALMAFPGCLAVTILLIFIDLLTKRKLALIPVAALILCAGPLWTYCPLNFNSRGSDGKKVLTLMTFNAYNFVNLEKEAAGIKTIAQRNDTLNTTMSQIIASDADIVCIQEGMQLATMKQLWSRQMDSLAAIYPYRADKPAPHILLSKYPFDTIGITQPESPTASFMCARFDIDSVRFTLFDVHLQSIGLNPDDKEVYEELSEGHARHNLRKAREQLLKKLSLAFRQRASQARLLRQEIDKAGTGNIIVAGDFNDIAGCYAMRTIEGSDLRAVYPQVGFGPIITYHANRFYFHIDHVLCGGAIKPLTMTRAAESASDHYPVTVTFSLPIPE